MTIKIPKKFQLFGQTIEVKTLPHLTSDNGTLGEAILGNNKIVLQESVDGRKLNREQLEWVFLHELTHMILFHMGEKELVTDEQWVDFFARLLHQALKTMEY